MNILFLMILFPDMTENPNLYTELAQEFHRNGHNVYVVTLLEKRKNQKTFLEKKENIHILHVECGDLFNVNPIKKGITTVSIPYRYTKAIKEYLSGIHFDLVVYPTPPITFGPVVRFLKKRDACETYLILRDIFPQNAKDLGMMRNGVMFHYFRSKEKELYQLSDYIGCMSVQNINFVKAHNKVDDRKLELLPNWKKLNEQHPQPTGRFREKFGLCNKVIAIFGGNLGVPQEPEFILELAKLYRDRDDIVFLIIGDGTEKKKLQRIIEEKSLQNVRLEAPISSKEYAELVTECDIGLINLNRKFSIPNIPSRTLSYFEAGIPILAAIDANTDYGNLLDESKSGLWSITGDLRAYQRNFETLLRDEQLRREMGMNGRKYMIENLQVEAAYQTIMKHFT